MALLQNKFMCTVTYIPTKNGFILTSNRDELKHRPTLAPALYRVKGEKLVFPKDEIAGGTWIASNLEEKRACLLNGAFSKHLKEPHHTTSRGKVLLESLLCDSFNEFADAVDLKSVEPFTLLFFNGIKNIEINALVWDGQKKHLSKLSNAEPQIWSSATLYDKEQRLQREKWFYNWLKHNVEYDDYQIFDFHQFKHTDEEENDIQMKRNNDLQTVSISQIRSSDKSNEFIYHDLIKQQQSSLNLKSLSDETLQELENNKNY